MIAFRYEPVEEVKQLIRCRDQIFHRTWTPLYPFEPNQFSLAAEFEGEPVKKQIINYLILNKSYYLLFSTKYK